MGTCILDLHIHMPFAGDHEPAPLIHLTRNGMTVANVSSRPTCDEAPASQADLTSPREQDIASNYFKMSSIVSQYDAARIRERSRAESSFRERHRAPARPSLPGTVAEP